MVQQLTGLVSGVNTELSQDVVQSYYSLTSVSDNLSATGTNQATGLQLIATLNRLTTVPLNSGVVLPQTYNTPPGFIANRNPGTIAGLTGLEVTIVNETANAVQIYVNPNDPDGNINGVSGSVGVLLPGNSTLTIYCIGPGEWEIVSEWPVSIGGFGSPVSSGYFQLATNLPGIDVTGVLDSFIGLRNAINNMIDGGTILFPAGAIIKLSATLLITGRNKIELQGSTSALGAGSNQPQFLWAGPANGQMFQFVDCYYPIVTGFDFQSVGAINGYLQFDGNSGSSGQVRYCNFSNPTANNSFVAISIAPTATAGNDSYSVSNCSFYGVNQAGNNTGAMLLSRDGVINNQVNTVFSLIGPFNPSMEGQPIRISYQASVLITTVTSVLSPNTVQLKDSWTFPSQTSATTHIDGGYGTGVLVAALGTSVHHRIYDNNFYGMQYGVLLNGGSADIRHVGGSHNDYAVYINAPSEQVSVDHLETSNDTCGVLVIAGASYVPVTISNSRLNNSNQMANGFLQLSGLINLVGNSASTVPATNQVLVGFYVAVGYLSLLSYGNRYGMSYAKAGLTQIGTGVPTIGVNQYTSRCWSQNDIFNTETKTIGMIYSPVSYVQLPTSNDLFAGMMAMINDSPSAAVGAAIASGGGVNTVLLWYSGVSWRVVGQGG